MKRFLSANRAFVLLFLGLGCGPSTPTEAEARAWLEGDAARVRTFDDEARGYIAAEGLLAPIPADSPTHMELSMGRERARAGYRERELPARAREASALGAQLRLIDGPDDTGILGVAGTPEPVRKNGNVAAEDGIEVDGRKIGWGVYGIDVDGGGVRDVRGYEVYWEAAVEGRMLSFRLFMPGR